MLSQASFDINFAYVSWVPPLKHENNPDFKVTSKPLTTDNSAYRYFVEIFDAAINTCRIEIHFKTDGNQENKVRKELLSLVQTSQIDEKMKCANHLTNRLAKLSDKRNGTGLFVIVEGKKANTTRIILNRFREDEVVFTKLEKDNLIIELLTEAFSKKSRYYKLAVYEDIMSDRSFWKGYAIDRQRTTGDPKELSDYWIKDFLLFEQAINPIQGTKVFSKVVKKMLKQDLTLDEKEQIISGILSLKHKSEQFVSIESFCNSYLSPQLTFKLKSELNDDIFFQSEFEIDVDTYNTELGSKVTGLDSGVIVTAPTFFYDKYVEEQKLDGGLVRLSTVGRIIDKKIDKAKKS